MTRYIGIDPSTKTGIVILDKDGRLIDGMELEAKGTDVERMADIIESVLESLDPGDVIAIEGFAHGAKGQGVGFQYGIGYGLRLALFEKSITHEEVAPAALKKFATGSGNTAKENLAVPIYKRWGFEHSSNNVRDAYVLAQIARAVYMVRKGMTIDLTAFQSAVVSAIIKPPSKRKRGA